MNYFHFWLSFQESWSPTWSGNCQVSRRTQKRFDRSWKCWRGEFTNRRLGLNCWTNVDISIFYIFVFIVFIIFDAFIYIFVLTNNLSVFSKHIETFNPCCALTRASSWNLMWYNFCCFYINCYQIEMLEFWTLKLIFSEQILTSKCSF